MHAQTDVVVVATEAAPTKVLARPLRLAVRPVLVVAGLLIATRCAALAGFILPFHGNIGAALGAAAGVWDAGWFQMIVSGGYAHSGAAHPLAVFYPGYSLLAALFYEPLRAVAIWLVPGYVPATELTASMAMSQDPLLVTSMLLASNLSLVVAVIALWRLFEPELGAAVTLIGCGLLLTAPSAFFLSMGYSESTFIATTALCFLFARRGRWLLAGLAGAAACVTREPGVWLLLALPILWFTSPAPRPRWPAAVAMATVLAGAAAFPAYCLALFGDPLLYFHLETSGWGHRPSGPIAPYLTLVRRWFWAVRVELRLPNVPLDPDFVNARGFSGPRTFLLDGFATFATTACAVLGWVRLHPAYVAWIVMMAGFPLLTAGDTSILTSMNRFVLAAWPAFFVAARVLRRVPPLAVAIMLVDLAAMIVYARDQVGGITFVG
jgi:hypothetical protein